VAALAHAVIIVFDMHFRRHRSHIVVGKGEIHLYANHYLAAD